MMNRLLEFIGVGIATPIVYFFYFVLMVLATFIAFLPIGVGIYLIDLAIKWMVGGLGYANL
mgnify:CR=1 FL=1|jgi:hypothetical protein